MTSTYAWMITKDHEGDETAPEGSNLFAVGLCGPSDAPLDLLARLKAGGGDRFTMRDDDGILYYSGRGLSRDDEWDEDACYGPLRDFGAPNAGAVQVSWLNHPDRDCDY